MFCRKCRMIVVGLCCMGLVSLAACAGSEQAVSRQSEETQSSGDEAGAWQSDEAETQAGSAGGMVPEESVYVGDVRTYPIPQENHANSGLKGYFPSATSDGCYAVYNKVRYYDAETGTSVYLCAQPGCTHTDETCQAWVGQALSYSIYDGELLAVIQYEEIGVQLIRKDLSTGAITVVGTWPGQIDGDDSDYYTASVGRVADHLAAFYLSHEHYSFEGGSYQVEKESSRWIYDLTTGEMKKLFPEEQVSELEIMALSKDYAFVRYTPEDAWDKAWEQYEKTPEVNYYGLLQQELRLYDLNTGEYTVIASSEEDQYIMSTDSLYTYGKLVVYLCGDTLYLFDLDTREERALLTMDEIWNYWIQDHKVFFIVHDAVEGNSDPGDYTISIYWADIDDGIPVRLGNAGNQHVLEFNAMYEGASFFIGYYQDGYYLISKEDFYADRYENVRLAP